MRRSLSLGAMSVVLVGLIATPAWGAGPVRAPAPSGALDLPDIFCGFEIHAEFPKNREYSLTFSDETGAPTLIRTTGAFATTLTNLDNGHSATFDISGPGALVPHGDGSTTVYASGTWLFLFAPDQLGSGSPGGLQLYTGHSILWTAANGFDQSFERSGTTLDVCAALA
jgi:hypothetical protein